MSEDLRDVPSRGDQTVDRAEYRRLSWEGIRDRMDKWSRGIGSVRSGHLADDIRAALERDHQHEQRAALVDIELAALRQRVEELEREVKLNRAAAEKHYAYGEAQKELTEAAEAEVDRLRAALERMVKDGCGFAPRVCPERSPDSEDWCWSCQARASLRGGGE